MPGHHPPQVIPFSYSTNRFSEKISLFVPKNKLFYFVEVIRHFSAGTIPISGEPSGPTVKTSSIPGPVSKQLTQDLGTLQV